VLSETGTHAETALPKKKKYRNRQLAVTQMTVKCYLKCHSISIFEIDEMEISISLVGFERNVANET